MPCSPRPAELIELLYAFITPLAESLLYRSPPLLPPLHTLRFLLLLLLHCYRVRSLLLPIPLPLEIQTIATLARCHSPPRCCSLHIHPQGYPYLTF